MKSRRLLAASLIIIGALLLWLAPESIHGLIFIGVGVLIEIVGIVLERRH